MPSFTTRHSLKSDYVVSRGQVALTEVKLLPPNKLPAFKLAFHARARPLQEQLPVSVEFRDQLALL